VARAPAKGEWEESSGRRVVAWHGHRRRGRGGELREESGGVARAPAAARVFMEGIGQPDGVANECERPDLAAANRPGLLWRAAPL